MLANLRKTLTRLVAVCALSVGLVGAPLLGTAQGGQGPDLDVEKWLNRPGVRMLAVEFYATWCKPCMEAVPRWDKLTKKYRDQGLRFIVIPTQDPKGACRRVGWDPDEQICDNDGHIANALEVGDELPAAFLWSWRGNLLVRRGHVDEVEHAIKRELARTPRIAIEPSKDKELAGIQALLRDQIVQSGKLVVVAGADERATLEEVRRRSHDPKYADETRCKLGEELAPNSSLKTTLIAMSGRKLLSLTLHSVETGCLTSSATAPWNDKRPRASVAEAIAELLQNLRVSLEMPGDQKSGTLRRTGEGDGGAWSPEVEDEVLVSFDSKPRGAKVKVGPVKICDATPCNAELSGGRQKVLMELKDHDTRSEYVDVSGGSVAWNLTPKFARLTVSTSPEGLALTMDKKDLGSAPLNQIRIEPGTHEVKVADRCFDNLGEKFRVKKGDHHTVNLQVKPRQSAVHVKARDDKNEPVGAEIYLDGVLKGTTPKKLQTPLCTELVELHHPEFGVWTQALRLREKRVLKVTGTFESTWLEVKTPEDYVRISLDGEPIGRSPIRRRVPPGTHEISVSDPCFHPLSESVELEQGTKRTLKLRPRRTTRKCQRTAQVEVTGTWVSDRIRVGDGRIVRAHGIAHDVPAQHATQITVYREGAVPWRQTVSLDPEEKERLTPQWSPVTLKGLATEDTLIVNGAEVTGIDGDQVLMPPGAHEIVVRRGSDLAFPTIQVDVKSLQATSIDLPAVIRVRSDAPVLKVRLENDGPTWNVAPTSGDDLPYRIMDAGTRMEIDARAEGFAPWTRTQMAEPGADIILDLRRSELPLDPLWDLYYKSVRKRTTSWIVTGVGGGVLAMALGLTVATLGASAEADDLFEQYGGATDPLTGASLREEAQTADDRAKTLGLATGLTYVAGAATIGAGIWMLMKNPEPREPQTRRPELSQPTVRPWLGVGGGGVSLSLPLP